MAEPVHLKKWLFLSLCQPEILVSMLLRKRKENEMIKKPANFNAGFL